MLRRMIGLEGEVAAWELTKFHDGGYIICPFNQYYVVVI
jgi:hypothetical protein